MSARDIEIPRDESGNIDWVAEASIESFPASDAPAWPSSDKKHSTRP